MIEYPPEFNTNHEPSDTERRIVYRSVVLRRVFVVAVTALLVVSLALTAVGVILIRGQQTQNAPLVDSTHQIALTIKSCTTPGEPCFEQAQRRTGNAVASINRVVILAAACAAQRGGHSVAEIQACVINRLARPQALNLRLTQPG